MTHPITRRAMLQGAAGLSLAPHLAQAVSQSRTFDPKPGKWRNFEVITTVQLVDAPIDATVWIPVPAVNTRWQRSLSSETAANGTTSTIETDAKSGARFIVAQFPSGSGSEIKVTSRVQTMDRAINWHASCAVRAVHRHA